MTDLRKAAIELLKSAPDHIEGHWPELDEVCKALAQPEQCICHRCIKENDLREGAFPLSSTRMILCPACGNKRCPKASDHRLACTESNESGQEGSIYTAQPEQSSAMDEWRSMVVVNLLRRCPNLSKHELRELAAHFESRLPVAQPEQEPVGVVQRTSIAGYPMTDSTGVEWLTQVNSGDKLYTAPPSKQEQEPLSDRENSIIRFALHQFMSNAYLHVNAAAQDKDHRRYSPDSAEKFTKDAKDAEVLLKRLQFTAPPSKPDVNQELVEALQKIAEYWNKDANHGAMYDACWHMTDTANAALAQHKEQA